VQRKTLVRYLREEEEKRQEALPSGAGYPSTPSPQYVRPDPPVRAENGRSVDTRPDPPSAGNSTRIDPKRLPSQTQDGGTTMNEREEEVCIQNTLNACFKPSVSNHPFILPL